ncbi:MAG: hypothetical protein LC781_03140 [Actinobacteria bacterium]|nr:hypothetical protein [Actinomycetota bacterium]
MGREPEERGFVLLGIKYEAAALGGVDEAGLARIEEQIQAEAGDDSWATHPMVVRGRNAVRAEHGLAPLGAPPREPARATKPTGRPLWRRLFGK